MKAKIDHSQKMHKLISQKESMLYNMDIILSKHLFLLQ